MGCGPSKFSFYPRRSKSSSKRNGAKTTVAVDNEEDEEESPSEVTPELPEEETEIDDREDVLPIADHQPTFEVSASQRDFFSMLEAKIEQGKDYDSTSETEIESKHERRRMLIDQWLSLTRSTPSSLQGSPPAQSSPPARSSPPAQRSPPARDILPAQPCPRLTRSVSKAERHGPSTSKNSFRHESPPARRSHSAQTAADWYQAKSPVKRTQSAGASWKPSKKPDEPVAGCSKDPQVTTTYNPTFQHHSPAKAQPYKAQIVSHPLAQQVAPPSPAKCIAPPEEYQDEKEERQVTVTTQSQIYYIHGSNATPDLAQQRQQTAMNLQQYVAMKQAQQQMFTTYLQRPQMGEGEELAAQYGHPGLRPNSAPPRFTQEVAHLGVPLCSPLPPVAGSWEVPPEMQYYPQSQFVPMFRAGAGSAGTLTRCRDKASLSVVRGKPVGQVVVGEEGSAAATPVASPDNGVSSGSKSQASANSPPPAAPKPKTKPKKKSRALILCKSLES